MIPGLEMGIVMAVAFGAAVLTFFSGFGLGTLLTPVMMVFLPTEVAIALTGVVHLANNGFKLALTGAKADRSTALRFGLPAIAAAFLGAWLLGTWSGADTASFTRFVAALLVAFALLDLLPATSNWVFPASLMPVGGFLSGFFGGLTGNQGALRSAFLLKAGLGKEAFVATTVVVSTAVDLTRIATYAGRLDLGTWGSHLDVVIGASLAAMAGAWVGHRMLKKVTLRFVQVLTGGLIILLAAWLWVGAG